MSVQVGQLSSGATVKGFPAGGWTKLARDSGLGAVFYEPLLGSIKTKAEGDAHWVQPLCRFFCAGIQIVRLPMPLNALDAL